MQENDIDHYKSRMYWENLKPSILGVYSMEGFGFPSRAAYFRFQEEQKIVTRLIGGIKSSAAVLDLGSGVGTWTEFFSHRFKKIVSVEYSSTLYKSLKERCTNLANTFPLCSSAEGFVPQDKFGLIFLGGLLTCLANKDVVPLLNKLRKALEPGGIILSRETTIPSGVCVRKDGNYQVVYRSLSEYRNLFEKSGLILRTVEANKPYIFLEIPCHFIKRWKSMMSKRFQFLPLMGRIIYNVFRIGYPWNYNFISWLFSKMGVKFPVRTNHFFKLEAPVEEEL